MKIRTMSCICMNGGSWTGWDGDANSKPDFFLFCVSFLAWSG
jgi:hypothetical protein